MSQQHSTALPPLATQLPLAEVNLVFGARPWRITAVQNQDALLDLADHLAHIPYGFLLWESAVALADLLVRCADLMRGKRVLELGAGMGLPGLIARSLGAEVWQTDHEPMTLALAAYNAQQNGITGLHHFVADWTQWTHTDRYDLLLGADILYERAMQPYVERIFHQNLVPGGRLLLADPSRPQAFEFAATLEKKGWHFEIDAQTVQLPERTGLSKPIDVMILTGVFPT
jgi:methyltransferase-like protein 23